MLILAEASTRLELTVSCTFTRWSASVKEGHVTKKIGKDTELHLHHSQPRRSLGGPMQCRATVGCCLFILPEALAERLLTP